MYFRNWALRQLKLILIVFPRKVVRFFQLLSEFNAFRKTADNRFHTSWTELYPCLADSTTNTPFDQHYIYHPAWAARILNKTRPELHIDISSILSFSSIVSAFIPIRFYDYRPAELNLPGLQSERADLLNLPFANQSIASLSCMHTIEHIGLGRYGDPLDPQGDLKAMTELKRVLKPGGDLLFVTPVGKPKLAFNAHRIYSYEQILTSFAPLQLQEFSLVPDTGGLLQDADPLMVSKQDYGCGCFWFRKPL
jgi:hypothetical protein